MFKLISGARNNATDCLFRLVKLTNNTKTTVRMLTTTDSDGPAFNTRSQTSQQWQTTKDTRPSHTSSIMKLPTPDLTTMENTQDIMPKSLTARDTKPYSRCRGQIHYVHVSQKIIQWQGTTAWGPSVYTCLRTIIQTCHGCKSEIFGPHYTQSLEIYIISGSTWQTQKPRSNSHLLSHQVPILLEKNEQGYPEIYS